MPTMRRSGMIYALLFQAITCLGWAGTVLILERAHARERAQLVNHALAETPHDYNLLQRAETPRRKPPDPDRTPRPKFPEGM